MERNFYIDLAKKGLRMPIGVDLVLKTKKDHLNILTDGKRLGEVMEEACRIFNTPLAFSLMDLSVEKDWILNILKIPNDKRDTFHFEYPFEEEKLNFILESLKRKDSITPRMNANLEALRYISKKSSLLPVGMVIGPFSLTTKLLKDPIVSVYLAGDGFKADDTVEIKMLKDTLKISIQTVISSVEMQCEANAKAIIICEPAANTTFFSPKQIETGSDIFERFVIIPNLEIKSILEKKNVDLIFHDCGELTDEMLKSFNKLNPVILSLGSSRRLWEDAKLIKNDIVLFGNLPTKKFYSDNEIDINTVKNMAKILIEKMKETNHPFILGSECDVLSVTGAENSIWEKVKAFCSFSI